MSGETLLAVEKYYQATQGSYLRWGKDPTRPDLYSLHFGYEDLTQPPVQEFDNQQALTRLTGELIALAQINDGMSVLDSGCGTGTVPYKISEQFPACRIVGTNISQLQLDGANRYNSGNQISPFFTRQDYHHTGFAPHSFDRVIFCESLAHSPDKEQAIQESARVLKPGGILAIADYYRPDNRPTRLSQKLWANLKKGWEIPSFIQISQLQNMMANSGFNQIEILNLTPNITRSATMLGDSCQRKLETTNQVPPAILNNRVACVAFRDLITSCQLGYFFVRGVKT